MYNIDSTLQFKKYFYNMIFFYTVMQGQILIGLKMKFRVRESVQILV